MILRNRVFAKEKVLYLYVCAQPASVEQKETTKRRKKEEKPLCYET